MNEFNIEINSKKLNNVNTSYTVLQVCEGVGISIPRFCYHRELSIAGNCRMCMVEIKNIMKPVVACATSLSKNMHIFTNSELVKIARENVLEFLLINHPLDCPICDQGGECDLQDQTIIYGSDRGRFNEIKRSVEDKNFGPIVKTVMTRCIHCTRCIRYAEEIIGESNLGTMGRGKETEISTYISSYLHHEMIGNITDICPVGALTLKPYAFKARPWELQSMELVDIFDSLGSSIVINIKGNELLRVLPVRNDNLNREWISDKIRFFYEGVTINRLLFPLLKKELELVHCSLNTALVLYENQLINHLNKNKVLLSIIGGELDLIESLMLKNYNEQLGVFNLYVDQYKKNINSDFRINWLLNNNLNNFLEECNIVLLNVHLKYECTVLNSLLYKSMNEVENKNIYYIGSIFKNNYNMKHIGLNNNTLRNIQSGQHEFCNKLINNKMNFLESGIEPLINNNLIDYINSINYNNIHKNAYLAQNATELNILENGINTLRVIDDLKEKKIGWIHVFGNINNLNLLHKIDCFKVFSSHHMPEKEINKFNLFMPVVNFYEVTSRNYPLIWLNNQLIGTVLFDYLTLSVGESKSNEYYINVILKLLELKLSVKFNMDINNYLDKIEINNKYKKYFITKIVYNSSYANIYTENNTKTILSEIYYKSNVYARNSITLNSAYNIEKNKIILNNYIY